ncbi:MAG: type II secretion system F family protein [Firmicutes bacterium]|nr:type II secretion system F family protein [Bacillota bacterium]
MKKIKFTNEEIRNICAGMTMFLHAGVLCGDGFTLLAEDEGKGPYRELFEAMALKADEGMPLHQIFRESGLFSTYVCALLEVGERTGRTEEALKAVATYYEEKRLMERHIKAALLYPAILLLIMLAVIVVLLVKVLPVFDQVYGQMGSSLTGIAGGLLAFGQLLGKLMPVLLVLLMGAVLCAGIFAGVPFLRNKVISLWNRKYGDRGVYGEINTARVAQVLSMGLKSGLHPEDALELAARITEDVPAMAKACRECSLKIKEGAGIIEAFKDSGILPPSECRLLDVGLRSGTGDKIMGSIAEKLLESSQESLADKVNRIEPALVVVTSVLIGLVLLSVMLPLVNIMASIS